MIAVAEGLQMTVVDVPVADTGVEAKVCVTPGVATMTGERLFGRYTMVVLAVPQAESVTSVAGEPSATRARIETVTYLVTYSVTVTSNSVDVTYAVDVTSTVK
jgi:hypothetical protein